jgi:cytidylate kinase
MAIVMISRGTYSGAKTIAEGLAERLGCPCTSQEDLFNGAREFGIPETELNAALVKPPSLLRLSSGKRTAILNAIRATLLKKSQDGNLVYHGFAGHLLLDNVYHILRVRVIASMEYRIEAAMRRHRESREQAIERIQRRDRQSVYWSRYLYGVDWENPSLYDTVLNLERVSISGAIEVLALMARLDEFIPDGATRQAFDDLLLGSLVWAELHRDHRTRAAQVHVSAHCGQVAISGNAESEEIVETITNLASSVSGVIGVDCQVGVGSHWFW